MLSSNSKASPIAAGGTSPGSLASSVRSKSPHQSSPARRFARRLPLQSCAWPLAKRN